MTDIRALQLPCGCMVEATHKRGDRKTTCAGGGIPRENHISDRTPCKGGVPYCVTAETVEIIRYSARRLP